MGGCYISYSNAPSDWVLKDGNRLPSKKYFVNPKFNKEKNTFSGKIIWGPNTFEFSSYIEYSIKFSKNLYMIESGTIYRYDFDS